MNIDKVMDVGMAAYAAGTARIGAAGLSDAEQAKAAEIATLAYLAVIYGRDPAMVDRVVAGAKELAHKEARQKYAGQFTLVRNGD